MESSSSSYKTFWRKRLPRRSRYIYRTLIVIAICLLFIVPTFLAWSVLNDLNKDTEMAELLYCDSMDRNTVTIVRKDLEECDRLEAELETADPGSAEYEAARVSYDSLRRQIAETMPGLVEGYDGDGLPILMTYKEYVKKTIK